MADVSMKDLINSVVLALETAITGGTLNAVKVIKGFNSAPEQVAESEYPYIMVDDGGERTEDGESMMAQNRFYSIMFEVGCYSMKDITTALDQVLDIFNETKDVLELQVNRFGDGFLWGIDVTTFGWDEDGQFYRGRQFIVDYVQLEDTRYRY